MSFDHLNLGKDDKVRKILQKHSDGIYDEIILYSNRVTKVNRKSKSQQRIIICTDKAIYNFTPGAAKSRSFSIKNLFDSQPQPTDQTSPPVIHRSLSSAPIIPVGQMKRRIALKQIHTISISSIVNEIVLHVPNEYDYLYKFASKKDIEQIVRVVQESSQAMNHHIKTWQFELNNLSLISENDKAKTKKNETQEQYMQRKFEKWKKKYTIKKYTIKQRTTSAAVVSHSKPSNIQVKPQRASYNFGNQNKSPPLYNYPTKSITPQFNKKIQQNNNNYYTPPPNINTQSQTSFTNPNQPQPPQNCPSHRQVYSENYTPNYNNPMMYNQQVQKQQQPQQYYNNNNKKKKNNKRKKSESSEYSSEYSSGSYSKSSISGSSSESDSDSYSDKNENNNRKTLSPQPTRKQPSMPMQQQQQMNNMYLQPSNTRLTPKNVTPSPEMNSINNNGIVNGMNRTNINNINNNNKFANNRFIQNDQRHKNTNITMHNIGINSMQNTGINNMQNRNGNWNNNNNNRNIMNNNRYQHQTSHSATFASNMNNIPPNKQMPRKALPNKPMPKKRLPQNNNINMNNHMNNNMNIQNRNPNLNWKRNTPNNVPNNNIHNNAQNNNANWNVKNTNNINRNNMNGNRNNNYINANNMNNMNQNRNNMNGNMNNMNMNGNINGNMNTMNNMNMNQNNTNGTHNNIKLVSTVLEAKELQVANKEAYLPDHLFWQVFKMTKEQFYALRGWKQKQLKRNTGFF